MALLPRSPHAFWVGKQQKWLFLYFSRVTPNAMSSSWGFVGGRGVLYTGKHGTGGKDPGLDSAIPLWRRVTASEYDSAGMSLGRVFGVVFFFSVLC